MTIDSTAHQITPPNLPEAACKGKRLELFFPAKQVESEDGKRVCRRCPVQAACLKHSIETPEEAGTWGGVDEWTRAERIAHEEREAYLAGRRKKRQESA